MAVKNYVLDTNVLLHDARAFYAFADNNVVIPIFVIEEIDTFKKDQSELGRNARQIARLLDEHRSEPGGLAQPQKMETGGTVRVALVEESDQEPELRLAVDGPAHPRDRARGPRRAIRSTPTILVTKDVNMRVRGDALGLRPADFEPEKISIEELYPGNRELLVPPGVDRRVLRERQPSSSTRPACTPTSS